MAEYLIQDSTLTAIANAIRTKTGGANPIAVTDMATQITGIQASGGGGKPFDCHSVTFMNGDQVAYVRSVADGDNCADPVSRNLIATPTKASDAQYDYTFYGWGASDGGTVDSTILQNITADKTVYAIYTNGSCGTNALWSLGTNGTLTIYGTGSMGNYTSVSRPPWYSDAANIQSVVISKGITSIGNYAFEGCTALTGVVIPDGLNTIGSYAFYNCTALTDIVLPDGLTEVPYYGFQCCTALTEINIPSSVTLIQAGTFRYTGLTSATFAVTTGWKGNNPFITPQTVTISGLEDPATAATHLTTTYVSYPWQRS